MQVGAGETVDCTATNVSTRTVTNIRITIRNFAGDPATPATLCQSKEPFASCAGGYSPGVNGHLFCEVTSDQGAKGLRATLLNLDTGASSDAR